MDFTRWCDIQQNDGKELASYSPVRFSGFDLALQYVPDAEASDRGVLDREWIGQAYGIGQEQVH